VEGMSLHHIKIDGIPLGADEQHNAHMYAKRVEHITLGDYANSFIPYQYYDEAEVEFAKQELTELYPERTITTHEGCDPYLCFEHTWVNSVPLLM
jgi:hypothetical protein